MHDRNSPPCRGHRLAFSALQRTLSPLFSVALGLFLACHLSARPGTDGLYAAADNNYRVEVRFEPGQLTVIEPNKTSVYRQRGSSPVYEFTNPANGIAFLLEVSEDGRGLRASKPGSPGEATTLNLIRPAGSETGAPAAGVTKIPVENPQSLHPDLTELWGVTRIAGVELAGRYTVGSDPRPCTELRANGTGVFEMYGAPDPQHIYAIRWWVQANRDGTLVEQDHEQARVYALIVEYDRPYQGNRYDRLQLVVQKAADGEIFILDRSKAKR